MATSLAQLKKDFMDRLFFYQHDALYIVELAKALKLAPNEYYKLYSLMGAQELENTLALFTMPDFIYPSQRINLRYALPFSDTLPKAIDTNETTPFIIGILSQKPEQIRDFLTRFIQNPLRYQHIRIVLGTKLKTKQNGVSFTTLLYGHNPFCRQWQEYIRKNTNHPKTFASHNNELFSNAFGVLSLGAFPYDEAFISDLVKQGLRLIETYVNNQDYSQQLTSTIEHFGLLRTGGFEK